MPNISQNAIGFDPASVDVKQRWKTGTLMQADDGKHYQYAKASATIAASTAVCNITLSSGVYVAAASGGTSTSPATAMAAGNFAWFKL